MAESTLTVRPGSSPGEPGTERAVRFAVYLTGGLVVLAFGVMELANTLGAVLGCIVRTDFCPSGFSTAFYFEYLPVLGGGTFLVAVAVVLLVLAHRIR